MVSKGGKEKSPARTWAGLEIFDSGLGLKNLGPTPKHRKAKTNNEHWTPTFNEEIAEKIKQYSSEKILRPSPPDSNFQGLGLKIQPCLPSSEICLRDFWKFNDYWQILFKNLQNIRFKNYQYKPT